MCPLLNIKEGINAAGQMFYIVLRQMLITVLLLSCECK